MRMDNLNVKESLMNEMTQVETAGIFLNSMIFKESAPI